MKKVEYSQIARRKLKEIRLFLRNEYGENVSKKIIKEITDRIQGLSEFPEEGVDIALLYDIDTEYFYIFVAQNYIIYRFTDDTVTVVQVFHEKEDFMMRLFGISGRTQESIDYWGE